MNKRLLLISTPYQSTTKALKLLSKEMTASPPLGLLYVACAAESMGWYVEVIDAETEHITVNNLIERIKTFRPELVGFSATTPFIKSVSFIVEKVKQVVDAKLILGGAHATVTGKECLGELFDYAFIGEADESFKIFLKSFVCTKDFSNVPGLIYRHGDRVLLNPPIPLKNLDSLPIPNRGLLKVDKYVVNVPKHGGKRYTSIMATRGCPYQCVYCSVQTIFGRTLRFRPISSLIKEVKECCENHDITHFHFIDDTLTVNRNYIIKLCNEILINKLDITWEGWTRADCIDEEILLLMKKSGFVRISFGVETGSPEIMKIIKKNVTHDQIKKAFAIAKKLDIESRCSVMIGHPGETKKTLWQTINFIRQEKNINYSNLSIATPYPGTELAEMAKKGKHGLELIVDEKDKQVRHFSPTMQMNDLTLFDLKYLQIVGLIWIHMKPEKIIGAIKRFGLVNILLTIFMTLLMFIKMILIDIFYDSKRKHQT